MVGVLVFFCVASEAEVDLVDLFCLLVEHHIAGLQVSVDNLLLLLNSQVLQNAVSDPHALVLAELIVVILEVREEALRIFQ